MQPLTNACFVISVVFQNIVLSGGSTMFKDFGKRLARDIKRSVDYRIKRSEELSGGKIKAVPLDVNVISHHMQRYAVWFGGSMLASTVSSRLLRKTCVSSRHWLSFSVFITTAVNFFLLLAARVLQCLPHKTTVR